MEKSKTLTFLQQNQKSLIVRRISLILFFASFSGFVALMIGNYVISSSMCLIGSVFIYEGGNKEKVYIENVIIVIVGVIIASAVLLLKEKAWEYIGTTM